MPKKKIFLDTNVCIDIASRKLDQEWSDIRRYVLEDYKYVISPLTILELLIRIGRGDKTYFKQDRKALQVLVGTKRSKTFLEFPGHFLLKHVVGNKTPAAIRPRDFEQWTRVVIKAPDKNALEKGSVRLAYPRLAHGLDFTLVDKQLQNGKDGHRKTLEGVRDGSKIDTSPLFWSAGLLKGLKIKPHKKTCEKVSKALEAAYHFDRYLWKQAKNKQYDFKKHDSDWVDMQQLFYLCDESVWFVTQDKNLLNETKGSSQGVRIVSFKTLRNLLAARCKLF